MIARQLHDMAELSLRPASYPPPVWDAAIRSNIAYLTALIALAEAEVAAAPPARRGRRTGQALVVVEWTALAYRLHLGKWPGQTKRSDGGTPFLRICNWLVKVPNSSLWSGPISREVVAKGIAAARQRISAAEIWTEQHHRVNARAHVDRELEWAMLAIATDNNPRARLEVTRPRGPRARRWLLGGGGSPALRVFLPQDASSRVL